MPAIIWDRKKKEVVAIEPTTGEANARLIRIRGKNPDKGTIYDVVTVSVQQ